MANVIILKKGYLYYRPHENTAGEPDSVRFLMRISDFLQEISQVFAISATLTNSQFSMRGSLYEL